MFANVDSESLVEDIAELGKKDVNNEKKVCRWIEQTE
jgi:hypothetical protein